ncbi:protein FAR1-RELATED SEQUENCE 12-like [Arachis ipaensis]|uniref:protein FAR1-RELATED SEQUENCE 12-like n=1 Tax=Arachis ipaensis TaxID=130454 RepID=UPI0007AFBC67|nr:protein FAR1-RELATED SEQUENCE 12-like [Arachis ipaensis]
MVTNRDHWTDLEAMGFEEQEGVYDTRIEAEETIAEYEGKEDPIFHELKGMEGLQVEDILQMEFCTPEEARYFYNSYSRLKGFFTRQGKKVTNKAGEIIRYTFVCNRQGFRDKK